MTDELKTEEKPITPATITKSYKKPWYTHDGQVKYWYQNVVCKPSTARAPKDISGVYFQRAAIKRQLKYRFDKLTFESLQKVLGTCDELIKLQ
jgi:hypothetical protein